MKKEIYCVGVALSASYNSNTAFELDLGDSSLPRLMHDPTKLKTASRYTGIYRISDDFKTVYLLENSEFPGVASLPKEVNLTYRQQEDIKAAIDAGYWYNWCGLGGRMGSISFINRNPRTWPVINGNWQLKEIFGGEKIIKVRYGEFDDELCGMFDLEMFMRVNIYEKLLSGEYRVSPDSCFKKTLVIVDKSGNTIKPVKEDFCY